MAEFNQDRKMWALKEAQEIRDFLTKDLINWYWDLEPTDTERQGMLRQVNIALDRLQRLKDRLRYL